MSIGTVDETQRRAATVVGVTYLFAMAVSILAEGYVGGRLIAGGDAAATARNILAHEALFRLATAGSLIIVVSDVALISALYVILRRVNEPAAVFAAFVRLIGSALYATAALNYLDALRLLGRAAYLHPIGTDQAQAWARFSISAYSAGQGVSFVYLGLGSTVFGYLWVKSHYVPKALGVLGVIASFMLAAGALIFVLSPAIGAMIFPAYMVPLFCFEVGMGVWLLVKGLRPGAAPLTPAVAG